VVHPRIVIISPIPGTTTAHTKQSEVIIMVVITFCFIFIPLSGYTISSNASLAGRTQIGAAAKIAKTNPMIAILKPQFVYGTSKILLFSFKIFRNSGLFTNPKYPKTQARIYRTTTKHEPETTIVFILV